ncbi:MAG: penicillin-binding protein 1C [Flammeovirgaceae bacterium]
MKRWPRKLLTRLFLLIKKYRYPFLGITFVLLIAYYFCLPNPLFSDPICTVLVDRQGDLLGARIAEDGQWRFPHQDSVPLKFEEAIIAFEDKRFYQHLGIDPFAILRAAHLNLKKGSIVSGGSTLSMQVIRLARKGQSRTFLEKIIEMIMATRLELRYSKKEILSYYAAYAPFGGNVVGLDAAAWKYYGRKANQLSWAEAATLAVLPNSPSLIHPGKNRHQLREKRNHLIDRLYELEKLDSTTAYLAKLEALPARPMPLPNVTPHLTERIKKAQKQDQNKSVVHTTVDYNLQVRANGVIHRHYQHLKQNGIYNAGALVVEVETGDVLAYVGNTPTETEEENGAVDVVPAARSTGSILKPFLYASMIQDGQLLPHAIVPDVPAQFGGYAPKNYDFTYDGALPVSEALARSLNVPFVNMLSKYGVAKFQHKLKGYGMTTLVYPPNHYGLTLILGGSEASLWDLAGIYASMARTLNNFQAYNGQYDLKGFHPLNYQLKTSRPRLERKAFQQLSTNPTLSAGAIWHTMESMVEVVRPGEEGFWRNFHSSSKIAWKTGTSFGFRDAWAIGCTPEYVIAVWVGNASGEGRPGLTGIVAAAPILFDLFNGLPRRQTWFEPPWDELRQIETCRKSGFRAAETCPDVDSTWVYEGGLKTKPCSFHQTIHLDGTGTWQVHSDCENPTDMVHEAFFVLPPSQEAYYKNKNPDYRLLPPFREDCLANASEQVVRNMELIYPKFNSKIYVPIDLDGTPSSTVFEITHRDPNITVYWHLDDNFIAQTRQFHEIALNPAVGKHRLVLVDEKGERLERSFEILAREVKNE